MLSVEEFETALRRHVLDVWFPRCLDHTHGGFLCDFDRRWASCGPHDKLLEFQARQTLMAADACRRYPADQRLREATLHGFRYLGEVMWDGANGGWFHRLDRSGQPLESHTKHAHGAAYAIEACAAVHEATGDPAAMRLARDGFDWLDRYARDREFGGYFGFLTRDNVVIRDPSDCPWRSESDTIGTEIGLKDANVHSDLLETFVQLYRVWPDARVGERLAEVLDIVCDKMVVPSTGALHIFVTADWRPLPHLSRAGYECQTAYRLTSARGLTGDVERLGRLASRLLDHALRYTGDLRGGFRYAAPGASPRFLVGQDLLSRDKPWWVQAEALKALLAVSRLFPERADYLRHFEALWDYIQRQLLDRELGGVYSTALDAQRRWRRGLGARFAAQAVTRKGDMWKDASHDGRALLYCVEHLAGGSEPDLQSARRRAAGDAPVVTEPCC
jgi:cellobiose epimerase